MRILALAAFYCVAAVPIAGRSVLPASPDDAAIREVARKYVEARDKRDPKQLALLFTDDADQLTRAGGVAAGT